MAETGTGPAPATRTTRPSADPTRPSADPARPPGGCGDVIAIVVELALVAAACGIGLWLTSRGVAIHASAAPLFARWLPHVGPGTLPAVAIAGLVVVRGPAFAVAARRGVLLTVAYLAALAWTIALALVDGWQRGFAGRLTTDPEYLHDIGRVGGIHTMLSTFTAHITGPQEWTTHVAGHPPGALLVFVGLHRIGLSGGVWAGLACVAVGALAPIAVAVTVWTLGTEAAARAVLPFLVLFPGAVWVGVSADGLFMGVAAVGLMLVALPGVWRPVLGGVVLGVAGYLSYGLILLAPLVLVVLVARQSQRIAAGLAAVGGMAVVAAAFTTAGFWWLDGYRLVKVRYLAGWGGERPYGYWVWADLACLVVCAGPVAGPALVRAVRSRGDLVGWLALAAGVAILAADVSGLSKGEVERIWLPYAIWLLAPVALLPAAGRRGWLALQAMTALLVNHLLLTHW